MIGGREHLHERLDVLWAALIVCAGLLGLRLLQVQVIEKGHYSQAAERNRTQLIRQTAPRGRIYDRKGAVLASNQAVFSLIFLPVKGQEADDDGLRRLASDLAPHLRQEPEALLRVLLKAIREESAIRLAEKLPPKVMFKLSELRTIYPGVNLVVEARRFYPQGQTLAHSVGYLGKMDESSWKQLRRQGYRIDSWVGRAGIEKVFERDLRGQDGGLRMEVDARGRLRRILTRMAWKPGSNIALTIDAGLQRTAEEALRKSPSGSGGVVAIDPRSGKVLVLASEPSFDPNTLLAALPEDAAAGPKDLPEFNYALQGSYPPGSTFKVITGAALLDTGKVDPKERVHCPGYFELGRRIFLCWEPKGHKFQDWMAGITHSCDVYFYRMGLRTGGDVIERYARMFRLGERTRLGLPGESGGQVFGPETRRAKGRPWYEGDTVNLSIGQGELLVTPMQMAMVMMAVANGGVFWRPHIIERIEYADGRPEYRHKPEELSPRVELKPETWDLLRRGLEQVVKDGTGRGAQVSGVIVAGKTGTAQNPGKDDHAWFVAYAGREGEPASLALAVLVQFGGHGAEAAVPVARQLIQAYFKDAGPAPQAAAAQMPIPPGAYQKPPLPVTVR